MANSLFNPEQMKFIRLLERCELNSFQKEFLLKLLKYEIKLGELELEYLQLMLHKHNDEIQRKLKYMELYKTL